MVQNDGQVSGGQAQPEEKCDQRKEARSSLSKAERFKKLEEAKTARQQSSTTTQQCSTAKIQRVPFMLRGRKNFKKFYVPTAVAIGPFHHGKPEYGPAEKFKYKLAAYFIEESGTTKEDLYSKIEQHITELKACYEDETTKPYNDEYLASMLFVDGRSILQFIHKRHEIGELLKMQMKRDLIAFEEQDLFLLENQVPYKVLELLMSSSEKSAALNESIKLFVHNIALEKKYEGNQNQVSIEIPGCQPRAPTHLLELLRKTMLGSPVSRPSQTAQDRGSSKEDSGSPPTTSCTHHRLELLPRCMRGPSKEEIRATFRNVQELHAAGIYFRPSEGKYLTDISFEPYRCFAGILKLPRIKVDDSTGPKFMNLIAFEMCPDFENDFGITSYIGFLDSLIDHADDVKHLRKTGILHNLLGSDEEVAGLFNEIGTDLVPNDQTYRGVKIDIQRHYKARLKSWIAIFIHERFSSPWTLLAFLGALSALMLTSIQTWYTLHPPR